MTRGAYKRTWGSGADADGFTLNIVAVPEASTWAMMLLGFAGFGLPEIAKRPLVESVIIRERRRSSLPSSPLSGRG